MLVGHVSSVVKEVNKSVHNLAAVVTGIDKLVEHSLLFDEAFLASGSLGLGME